MPGSPHGGELPTTPKQRMLLFLLAFLGGTLTILSPCVLPVIPFVFAQSNRPFRTNGLPTLVGMAVTFAAVASAAAVGGGWVVRANQVGRAAALVLLAAFGVALLLPSVGDRLMRPLVALGGRLQQRADARAGIGGALLLGVAVGFLWAPCAGPVLGLILTSAALGGASARTTLLLLAFAAGAAVSLGLATAAGSRVFAALKRRLGAEEWIRRGLGAAVLIGVVAVAMGWDTGILARLSLSSTAPAEQRLVDRLANGPRVDGATPTTPLAGADVALATPATGALNAWGLVGKWTVGAEAAVLVDAPGRIVFRFRARDLHLVLGPATDGRAIRFRVRVDGHAPMADHGTDTAGDGSGTVTTQRLYQLVRQRGVIVERTFEIEFLDPGVSAYAFTFG